MIDDPMVEYLDVVDPATGMPTGRLERSRVHTEGHWHQVFHCLIVRPATGTIVLQERAPTKRAFPGLLDLSATGHLSAGESVHDGVREVTEELGIELTVDRLIPLGSRLLADRNGEGLNRERMHVFLYDDDRPLHTYAPDQREVAALVEVNPGDLLGCFADPVTTAEAWRLAPGRPAAPIAVAATDLVPAVDGYWVVLLVMALRHLRGEGPLAI